MVDRLLRGRAWIWLIGLLLGGIVAVQVSLLKLNSGISRAVETTNTLQRRNSALEAEIARLDSGERIRTAALGAGMVDPSAGDTRYLRARAGDAALAARRVQPPSAEADAVMANGGRAPGTAAASTTAAASSTAAVAATPAATATPLATATPVPTATPAATATATPVQPLG
jgi:hypothetical protein